MTYLNNINSPSSTGPGINNYVEQDFRAKAYERGKTMGEGMLSEVKFLFDVLDANCDGALALENAEQYWSDFRRGVAESKGAVYIKANSEKNRASVLKTMMRLARLPHGLDVCERTCEIIKNSPEIKQSTTRDALYAVGNAQLKKGQVETALTDDQIMEVLAVQEKAAKTEAQRLQAILKSMERLRDGTKDGEDPGCPSVELDTAISAIGARLVDVAAATGDKVIGAWLVKQGYRI